MHFFMRLVIERVIERLKRRKISKDQISLDFLMEGVSEVLPIDEERKIEMEVWLAFSAKVLVDAKLRELSNKVYKDMHQGLENVVQALKLLNIIKDELDLD